MRRHQTLLAVVLGLMTAVAGATERYAIVVAVSSYPNLDPSLSLVGPANDAMRVQQMLAQQGFAPDRVRLLADGIHGTAEPTRANIVAAFTELQPRLTAGDFVYLHFSGHGSQQPASDLVNERDGLDEIFLPRDVSHWNKDLGAVPNSISDDDINGLVTHLRRSGAHVWAVFDSCHSGTMTRSVTGNAVRMRQVKPATLGIPAITAGATGQSERPAMVIEQAEGMGDLIAFFAAQSTEEAPEMALASGDQLLPQGLFTHTLTSVVGRNPNISYRQLAQLILSTYNSKPWHRTTPLFEGTTLDKPLFHRDVPVAVRYAVAATADALQLQAGQLAGFELGAVVALYDAADGKEPVATAEVSRADLATASLTLLEGSLTRKTAYAELKQPALPAPLTIKWLGQPATAWRQATTRIQANQGLLGRTLRWTSDNSGTDIALYANHQQLYLFTADNELPCPLKAAESQQPCSDQPQQILSVPLPAAADGYANLLESSLERLVRAHNLLRLSSLLTQGDTLDVRLMLKPRGASTFAVADGNATMALRSGDELKAEFINRSREPLDLTILFIDSGLGITQIYPEPGASGRLFAGESTDFEGVVDATSLGSEQLLVIATPVSRQDPPTSLAHLQQPALASTLFTRSLSQPQDDLFAQALGDAPRSRGFGKKSGSSSTAAIRVIRWQTVPDQP